MSTSNLAQQALNNLVNQFARPMDFLRELVQNSIDAGSPRVEVWVKYIAGKAREDGVLEIHIADFGEGMDERIIDEQLTRMFSSTKEDDLTKIGKFGIGFTSSSANGRCAKAVYMTCAPCSATWPPTPRLTKRRSLLLLSSA